MCLQIYIKVQAKYTLAFVPDAKAFTDAPDSMTTLMKQRRRWMNGSLFGTSQVIGNFVNMVSCRRTKHHCCRQIMMTLFMTYTATLFVLQFFIVGAMFAAIYVFYSDIFASVFEGNWALNQVFGDGRATEIFAYCYVFLLVLCLIISLALPLDRAKPCLVLTTVLFGIMTLSCLFGMCYFLALSGFYPEEKVFDKDTWQWHGVGKHYFSPLVLAGVIMLSVYLVPIVMRPIDFLANLRGYVVGLIAYLCLIPMFTNVFQIYAMSNLHDVSWGNRPSTSGGTEAFSAKRDEQQRTLDDYKTFRANFLFLWLCGNGAYFLIVLSIGTAGSGTVVNDGSMGVLEYFSLYLAAIVVFRVTFAILHTLKWKWRFTFNKKYKIGEYSLEESFAEIKQKFRTGGDSTDDEWLEEEA